MIKTSELWQIKDILKALIMSSVLGNFTKCTSAVLYTKNVCVCVWGATTPKTTAKAAKEITVC